MQKSRIPLVLRRFLDPRPAAEAVRQPIRDAVNIPLAELGRRMHELPPRERRIPIVGSAALAQETGIFLQQQGRQVEITAAFQYELTEAGLTAGDALASGGVAPAAAIGRLWEPNPFLAEAVSEIEKERNSGIDSGLAEDRDWGRTGDKRSDLASGAAFGPIGAALDLACGTGRDAIFLAARGWDVTAADLLPDALELGRDLERRCAAAVVPVRWKQVDLEAKANETAFGPGFEFITIFRYLHRPLLGRLCDWLVPGGHVIIETFTELHRQRHGKPRRAAFVLQPGELRGFFGAEAFEIRHASEDWRGEAHTARLWARKREVVRM